MRIKYSFKAIENFLKSLNVEYKITPDGEIAINSPFMSDTTFDCRISIDKQCYHDFESDESGGIEKLAAVIADVDQDEVRQLLLTFGMSEVIYGPPKPKEPEIIDTKTITMPPGAFTFNKNETRGTRFNSQLARKFLVEKLASFDHAKRYDLRWTEMSYITVKKEPLKKMNLSYRIIIPSYEEGNLVYYQARDYIGKSDMRYKNPTKDIQPKSIVLPFYDLLLENEILFISEGPWEAIQYGGTYMLGNALSDRQILKIKKKNPKAIYIIPDNDETARRKLSRNIELLRSYMDIPIYIVRWWTGDYVKFKDPIDAGITFDDLVNCDFIEANRNIELRLKLGAI